MGTEVQRMYPVENGSLAIASHAGRVQQVVDAIEALKAVQTFVAEQLKPTLDFGSIPGTGNKLVLLKPGAEKVALFYNTRPDYTIQPTEHGAGHVEYLVKCELISRETGAVVASGHGSCATLESKYRWRKSTRTCPECGAAAIIQGKAEYGGGWVCFKKQGGCGEKFYENDESITGQPTGRSENPDIWDQRNTVMKMALKRALVSAVLTLGSLSDRFTQDIEETFDLEAEAARTPREQARDAGREMVNQMFGKPDRIPDTSDTIPDRIPDTSDTSDTRDRPKSRPAREKRRDPRTLPQLIEQGHARHQADFLERFPEHRSYWEGNVYSVERHMVKHAREQGWSELPAHAKQHEVREELERLDQSEHRPRLVAELLQYLAKMLRTASNHASEAQSLPMEPGSNG